MQLLIFPAIDDERLHANQSAVPHVELINAAHHPEALAAIAQADGFYGKLTPDLLAAAPHLRWVQAPTASLEHYLFPELVEHDCWLSNMRGLFSDVVAEHAFALLLGLARHIPTYARQQFERHWAPVGDAGMVVDFVSSPGTVGPVDRAHRHLGDQTLGIIGVGAIGQAIAQRAHAFEMRILGIDPFCREIPGVTDTIWPVDQLDRLLSESDHIVLAAPHTPRTAGMIRRPQLQRIRRDALLINVGRGALVDLDDLTAALVAGEIGGAGLDVCQVEPLPPEHPLWTMANVLITPHVGAASPRIAGRHLALLIENIREVAAGRPPRTLVNKREWF